MAMATTTAMGSQFEKNSPLERVLPGLGNQWCLKGMVVVAEEQAAAATAAAWCAVSRTVGCPSFFLSFGLQRIPSELRIGVVMQKVIRAIAPHDTLVCGNLAAAASDCGLWSCLFIAKKTSMGERAGGSPPPQ